MQDLGLNIRTALVLDSDHAPVPAGITRDTVPSSEGRGVRYLAAGATPPHGDVVAALTP
ncbi:hypothetical protein ACIOG4_37480 [Streptomyces microflavus]|uniref:hypothetical protein n=1 Tax=Streptomyces microflavus TaxID=1919 RepID=UPI00380D488D